MKNINFKYVSILFIILLTIIYVITNYGMKLKEYFINDITQIAYGKKAICILTKHPDKIWCEFLSSFSNYKIFIVIDDNVFNLQDFIYKNITFIKIEDEKCINAGFKGVGMRYGSEKLINAWDKAIYYFCKEDPNYDYVWFLEDDVFFYNEHTLINIDNKYKYDDLLSNKYGENTEGKKEEWHWPSININYPPPYYNGLMCIVRFSKYMLNSINEYVTLHKMLFYLEALFPTIAIKNKLIYSNPIEFNNITLNIIFDENNIDKHNIFHPVKDLSLHKHYREIL